MRQALDALISFRHWQAGDTPLHEAVEQGCDTILEMLIREGAPLNRINRVRDYL